MNTSKPGTIRDGVHDYVPIWIPFEYPSAPGPKPKGYRPVVIRGYAL